jgi:hypothetical protein
MELFKKLSSNDFMLQGADFEQFRETATSIGLYWLVSKRLPVVEDSRTRAGEVQGENAAAISWRNQ